MRRLLGIAATYGVGRLVVTATLLVPGVLGADLVSLGRIELLLASVSMAWAAGPLGTPVALSHERFRDRRRDWRRGIAIAMVGGGIVAGALQFVSGADLLLPAVAIGAIGATQRIAQGRLRVDDSLTGVLVATTLMLAAFVGVLVGGVATGRSAAAVTPIALLAAMLTYSLVAQRFVAPALADDGTRLPAMLRFGIPLAVGSMFSEVVALADRFLIEWLMDTAAVGRYGLAYRWVALFGGAGAALTTWWQAEAFRRGENWSLSVAQRVLRWTVVSLLAAALAVWMPLAWLTAWTLSVPLDTELTILILGLVLGVVGYVVGTQILSVLAATGRTLPAAWAWGAGAVVNLILNLGLIPVFGLVGAAWSTTLSTVVVAVVAHRELRAAWRRQVVRETVSS